MPRTGNSSKTNPGHVGVSSTEPILMPETRANAWASQALLLALAQSPYCSYLLPMGPISLAAMLFIMLLNGNSRLRFCSGSWMKKASLLTSANSNMTRSYSIFEVHRAWGRRCTAQWLLMPSSVFVFSWSEELIPVYETPVAAPLGKGDWHQSARKL